MGAPQGRGRRKPESGHDQRRRRSVREAGETATVSYNLDMTAPAPAPVSSLAAPAPRLAGVQQMLLWAVAEDIRILIRLAAAFKQGQSVQSVRNSLRLWGDKQTLAPIAVKRIPAVRLIEALKTCAKIDRIIKGAEDGDAWTEFKQLVTGLAV